MAIQGAPRRLRDQNPNAQQIPSFNNNQQQGNMGGAKLHTFGPELYQQQQGNMGGGGLMGGAGASNSPYANSAFSDMPVKPRLASTDMPFYIDPITGQQGTGGSTTMNYRNNLKSYFDNNAGAQDYYNQLNPSNQPPMAGNMGGGGLLGGSFGDIFGGMLPPVSMPVSEPRDYSYAPDDTGLPQGYSYSQPKGGMYSAVMPSDGGSWVYGPQGRVSTNNPSFLNAPTGFGTAPSSGNTGAGQGGGGFIGTMGGTGYGEYPLGTAGPRVDPSDPNYRPEPNQNPALDNVKFYTQTGNGAPTINGVNNMANPYTTDVLTGPAASTSGPSDTMAYGGALLGGLLGNDLSGALQAAGGYYAGQQGIEGAMATGQAGLGLGEAMGKRAYDQSQFRPFGVTSNLANVQTTPEGGVNLNLSPEQQAMQQQLLGQSRGLFGQVGADPAAAQSALYEQIRATQQPEEERQRLQMQENLFSSGRGGVQTAMYGGTPEQMAYEKARQESMLNANLAARTQSQAEQLQAGQLGGMLQQAGYNPQRQAIDLFGASGVPAQLAAKGQLGGAELQSQAGGRGLESYMQGANMANLLQQQQLQGLMTGAVGKPLTAQEQLMNAMIGRLGGTPIEAGGGMLGGVLDWGKELLGFGEDKPNFTLNPSEIDKLSDAEKEQALYDLFN